MSESAPITLAPLQCLHCQAAIPAQVDEVAWVCETCGQGQLLLENGSLQAISVFFSKHIQPGAQGHPFWVAEGSATLQRETYHGNQAREMQDFWRIPRRFFVPAYALPLQEVINQGAQFLSQPLPLEEGSRVSFQPVTVPAGDVRPLAEFILLGIEADRRDALKTLKFELTLGEPQLWILP